jgi:hypothetical protein
MDETVKRALERYQIAEEAEADYRREAREDLKFISGDQWNWQARNVRENAGLPCFTINRIPTFLNQILNEIRQNNPSIQVDPVSDGATKDTAETLAGLIRQIEQHSAATTAYQNAAWYAVASGRGYFELCSEYEGYENNDQKLVIKTIDDPTRVYIDPNHREVDGHDMEYAFIIYDMDKDEYKREYPDSQMSANLDNKSFMPAKNQEDWISKNTVRVAKYYYKVYNEKTLYTIRTIKMEYMPFVAEDPAILMNPEAYETIYDYTRPPKEMVEQGIATVIGKRKVHVPEVRIAKINALEVLEETVWPYKHIPVFIVKGNEFWNDGKRIVHGAVRFAKDTQRALNWFTSVQAEVVGMAPKAPFVGGKGAFAGFEHLWRDVNVSPIAYLEFNDKDAKGNPITPPQRVQAEAPIQAIAQSRQMASDDLKGVFGIFDPSLGAQGNETSGVAILARTEQSHMTNSHYYDNLVRTITHLGHVMVHVIPFFYDNERVIRIVNPNGTTGTTTINAQDGKNNFSVGKYEVVIQTGPTYQTRRQEAVEKMLSLGGAYPESMPAIADIIVNEMDWPGAKLIADRLRAMVPPQILQATGEMDTDDMDPEQLVKQQKMTIQQQTQALEQLNQMATQLEQELKQATEELKLTKMDKEFQVIKAELDNQVKNRELTIEEATTQLEFLLKERELEFEDRKIKLEEAKVAMMGVKGLGEIDKSVLDTEMKMEELRKTMNTAPDTNVDMSVSPNPIKDGPTDSRLGGEIGAGRLGGKI